MTDPPAAMVLENVLVAYGQKQQRRLRRAYCTRCDWSSQVDRAAIVVPAWIRHATATHREEPAMPHAG